MGIMTKLYDDCSQIIVASVKSKNNSSGLVIQTVLFIPCIIHSACLVHSWTMWMWSRDVNQKPVPKSQNWFYFLGNRFSIFFSSFQFLFSSFSFSSRKFYKNYEMSDKIHSRIRLMLSVYKILHQTVNYVCQRNHMLQDLIGLEIWISIKANKTESRF